MAETELNINSIANFNSTHLDAAIVAKDPEAFMHLIKYGLKPITSTQIHVLNFLSLIEKHSISDTCPLKTDDFIDCLVSNSYSSSTSRNTIYNLVKKISANNVLQKILYFTSLNDDYYITLIDDMNTYYPGIGFSAYFQHDLIIKNSYEINILMNDKTSGNMKRLTHELSHYSMWKIFQNNAKPYKLHDDIAKEKFQTAIYKTQINVLDFIQDVYELDISSKIYDKNLLLFERNEYIKSFNEAASHKLLGTYLENFENKGEIIQELKCASNIINRLIYAGSSYNITVDGSVFDNIEAEMIVIYPQYLASQCSSITVIGQSLIKPIEDYWNEFVAHALNEATDDLLKYIPPLTHEKVTYQDFCPNNMYSF